MTNTTKPVPTAMTAYIHMFVHASSERRAVSVHGRDKQTNKLEVSFWGVFLLHMLRCEAKRRDGQLIDSVKELRVPFHSSLLPNNYGQAPC